MVSVFSHRVCICMHYIKLIAASRAVQLFLDMQLIVVSTVRSTIEHYLYWLKKSIIFCMWPIFSILFDHFALYNLMWQWWSFAFESITPCFETLAMCGISHHIMFVFRPFPRTDWQRKEWLSFLLRVCSNRQLKPKVLISYIGSLEVHSSFRKPDIGNSNNRNE